VLSGAFYEVIHFIFTPSVKRHPVKVVKNLHGASGLGMGKEENTKQNIKHPLLQGIYVMSVEGSSVGGNPIF
jgi:hypothetical protein